MTKCCKPVEVMQIRILSDSFRKTLRNQLFRVNTSYMLGRYYDAGACVGVAVGVRVSDSPC
jgi:hypothetical protein